MDQVDKPELQPIEDVPAAARDLPLNPSVVPPPARRNWPWLLMGGTLGILGLAGGSFLAWYQAHQTVQAQTVERFTGSLTAQTLGTANAGDPVGSTAGSSLDSLSAPKTLLGHHAYKEANQTDLIPLTADGQVQMMPAAAKNFEEMQKAAARDGVHLVPLSGFRSLKDQEYLFFGVKAERGQTAKTRAEVSAPPGYSEHHTGYAIDIGDGGHPNANVNESFADTPAGKWLQENAAHYDFEMSFPPNNSQGVNYEPWHWRFVGDQTSLETFYQK